MLSTETTFNFASITPNSLGHQTEQTISAIRQLIAQLIESQSARTVANTFEPYNQALILLTNQLGISNILENTHPDKQLRAAAEISSQQLIALATELSLNPDIYQAIRAVDTAAEDLSTKKLQEKMLKDFRSSGVDRDPETRGKIQQLQERLTKIKQEFERNIREDTRSIKIQPEELDGLPEDYIRNHPADDNGLITITTDYSDYRPFMSYAHSVARRKELYFLFYNRAYPANTEVLKNILLTAQELAAILNYTTYAHCVLDTKMAERPEVVQSFIDELKDSARKRAQADYQLLLEQKRLDDPSATVVYQYESAYYLEKLKTAICQLDSQQLRQYFPYQSVRDGLFRLVEQSFGVTISPQTTTDLWHPEVEYYHIREQDQLIGSFYLDMHPRLGKYNHAAQDQLQAGIAGVQLPLPVLICNFPGGKDKAPADSLMTHDEVETFFHEFGHLLHTIFGGQQRWLEQAGTSTEWDFVEVPSQFWEELAWSPEALKTFARHHATGAIIPDDLLNNLIASKNINKGSWTSRQLGLAQTSLSLYLKDPQQLDAHTVSQQIESIFSPYPIEPEEHFVVSFGHLANYTAAYYTYLWSLAIVHDFIRTGTDNNLMNTTALQKYRRTVLAPGGSRPAKQLINDFLGRDYNLEAFKSWLLN
jgi:thimet oligopeptidase